MELGIDTLCPNESVTQVLWSNFYAETTQLYYANSFTQSLRNHYAYITQSNYAYLRIFYANIFFAYITQITQKLRNYITQILRK